MTWRSTLHALLVRRYPDARDLRRLVDLQLPDLAADLPPEAPANRLAGDVIKAAEAHGRVPDLLCVLRETCDDEVLAQIVAPYLVETEDPALAQTCRAYSEHARRVARRPPLEELLGYLLDIPDFDLERVFIPLSAKPPAPLVSATGGTDDPRPQPRLPPTELVTDVWPEREPWLLLIGEPGAGKSILTRWFTAELARDSNLTPVRIELRRYASWVAKHPDRSGFLRFLGDTYRDEGIPLARELPWLALAGRVAWLVDGLDEISDPDLRADCAHRIAALRRRGGHALVTSRPRGVTRELAILQDAGLALRELSPLDDAQIQLLCTRWHGAGLLDDRARARVNVRLPELRELMRSPLVATLILVLARHGEIPRTRQRMLSEVLALVVHRWPKHRELLLDAPARAAFLRHLGWSMLTASAHGNDNLLERAALLRVTRGFLRKRTPDLASDVAATQASRLADELVTQVHVLADLGGGNYGFAHRSFLEFFAADALADVVHDGDRDDRFATRWSAPAWAEVLRMACGLLADRDPALVVRALTRVFARLPPFDAKQLVAASEFAVRAAAEVDDLGTDFQALCDGLTDLWIALDPIGGLDLRGLCAALRTLGPRWPAATRLLTHVQATGGRVTCYDVPEYSPQLSSAGPMTAPTVGLALAVAAVDMRPEFLRRLAGSPGALALAAESLVALGPWTPGERDLLVETFGEHGWEWDEHVLEALGDLSGSPLEADMAENLVHTWEFERISAAVTLLSSSTLRSDAVRVLRDLSPPHVRENFFGHQLFSRLLATLRRLDEATAHNVAVALRSSGSPGVRAVVELWLSAARHEAAIDNFMALLRSDDPVTSHAANWALAHGGLPKAVERVLCRLGDDLGCLKLVWTVASCAAEAENRGRWTLAEALWRNLADTGEWGPSMRWHAVTMLLRRRAWRAQGLARIPRIALERPPNSPNMDTALRALAEYNDGPALLHDLLAGDPRRRRDLGENDPRRFLLPPIDPDTLCRRFVAQVLLERDPNDTVARNELCHQAEESNDRHEQHVLAHLMRRVGLPRTAWEPLARKIPTHVDDPISRCAAAVLLADRDELQRLADAEPPVAAPETGTWAFGNLAGVAVLAAALLRCEDLRIRLAATSAK